VLKNGFTKTAGARPLAPHIVIVITDGVSRVQQATLDRAKEAKDKGIIMFTIGILINTCYDYKCIIKRKLNCGGQQFHQYQQNKQSPLTKECLNSDGHQLHRYQQNKQSPLILTH
jgi:hypothetical protein